MDEHDSDDSVGEDEEVDADNEYLMDTPQVESAPEPVPTQESYLNLTADKVLNTELIKNRFNEREELDDVLQRWCISEATFGEDAGRFKVEEAKLSYFIQCRHDAVCRFVENRLKELTPDVQNLEAINKDERIETMRKVRAAVPGWPIRLTQEPDVVACYEDQVIVVEVTTGEMQLVTEKLEKYSANESQGHLIVLMVDMTTPGKRPQVFGKFAPVFQPIVDHLQGPDVISTLDLMAADFRLVLDKEGMEERTPDMTEGFMSAFVVEGLIDLYDRFRDALSDKTAELFPPLRCEGSTSEVLADVTEQFKKLQGLVGTWRNKAEGHLAMKGFLERGIDAGRIVMKDFTVAKEDIPILDLIHDATEDTPFSEMTITSRTLDFRTEHFPVKAYASDATASDRAKRIWDHMMEDLPKTDPLVVEVEKLVNIGSVKVTKSNISTYLADLLQYGMKSKAHLGNKDLTYGSKPKEFQYPKHRPVIPNLNIRDKPGNILLSEQFNVKEILTELALKDPGVHFDYTILRTVLDSLESSTVDHMVLIGKAMSRILTQVAGLDFNDLLVLPMDAQVPIHAGGEWSQTNRRVPVVIPGEKKYGHGECPFYTSKDGRPMVVQTIGSGILLIRAKPGQNAQNKPVHAVWVYMIRGERPKLNFAGHVLLELTRKDGKRILFVHIKWMPYSISSMSDTHNILGLVAAAVQDLYIGVHEGKSFTRDEVTQDSVLLAIQMVLNQHGDARTVSRYILDILVVLYLRGTCSSRENEMVKTGDNSLSFALQCTRPYIVGTQLIENLETPTILAGVREQVLQLAEQLQEAGHLRIGYYGTNGPIQRNIAKANQYSDYKEQVVEDTVHIHDKFLKVLDINTDNKELEIETLMRIHREVCDTPQSNTGEGEFEDMDLLDYEGTPLFRAFAAPQREIIPSQTFTHRVYDPKQGKVISVNNDCNKIPDDV